MYELNLTLDEDLGVSWLLSFIAFFFLSLSKTFLRFGLAKL